MQFPTSDLDNTVGYTLDYWQADSRHRPLLAVRTLNTLKISSEIKPLVGQEHTCYYCHYFRDIESQTQSFPLTPSSSGSCGHLKLDWCLLMKKHNWMSWMRRGQKWAQLTNG